ncbi:MAG: ribonuclease III [Oscillospiraceae bacterium]|jgi:ribonuclease-3 family protein|nr:ribonuclease III [Oscillospiraceae bacterium]
MEFERAILSERDAAAYSPLALAHIGDAVYELFARTRVTAHGGGKVGALHRETVKYVAAPAQAAAFRRIEPQLTDAELTMFKRGRNANGHPAPNSSTSAEYHAATGLETLFGWLYLTGQTARAGELFELGNEMAVNN